MTFSVRQYMADQQLEPYPFEDIDGVIRHLPNMLSFTAGEFQKIMAKADMDPLGALTDVSDEDTREALERTPIAALIPLIERWQQHSTQNLGESSASSSSSKSTARPSKPTSRASTKAKTRKR